MRSPKGCDEAIAAKTMDEYNNLRHQRILLTHNIAVPLPVNTKYTSGNPVGRLLIRGFMRALVELATWLHPRTVLDIGCGEGVVLRQLGILWDKVEIHGVDINIELLQAAQQVAPNPSYLAASVFQLPLVDRYYDLVICTEVLEHLENPKAALAEIVRVGKGHCLLSVPHEPWWRIINVMRGSYLADWGNTPGHVNHWSRRGFIGLLNGYLDVVAVRQPFPWLMVLGRVRSWLQQ